jgi:hypothetical protein
MSDWVLILILAGEAGGLQVDFNTRQACIDTKEALKRNDESNGWGDRKIKFAYCAYRGKMPDDKVEK